MKTILALIAAALLSAPAAPPIETGQGTQYFDGMPPARYQGEGATIALFVHDVTEYCGTAPAGLTMIACVRRTTEGVPVAIMPLPSPYAYAGETYARIVTHELGHVLGWPGDHPE